MNSEFKSPQQTFEAALQAGTIQVQQCGACGALRFPPREVCHACLSSVATWRELQPQGHVVSYIVVHATTIADHEVPFCVVHVEFEGGLRMTGKLALGTPAVGLKVLASSKVRQGRLVLQFDVDPAQPARLGLRA